MIFDKIENWERYLGISDNMDKALTYMAQTDLAALADGRHEIDGDNVFVNVMQAATDPDKKEYEFHKEYYDVQIDLAGNEDICFSTECQETTRPYSKDGDIGMGICQCEALCHLSAGRFAVCEPEEMHLPGVAPGAKGEQIRKAVIKVHK